MKNLVFYGRCIFNGKGLMKVNQTLPRWLIETGFAGAVIVLLMPILGIGIPREIAFAPALITLSGILLILFLPRR